MTITDRDDEFRATITALYEQELGREPEPHVFESDSWMGQLRNGMTGEQMRQALHDSAEGVAYRGRPTVPPTPRLHVEGLGFITADGAPWTMAFVSSFRLYERLLHGEDITPLLQEAVDVGANGLRVFGAFDFGSPQTQRLYPAEEHVDYYDLLQPFFALLQSYGLYAQFTAFADTQRSVPGAPFQSAHWASVCNALRDVPNVLLERVNEADAHENRVDATLQPPTGICCSFGSNGGGSNPPGPYWDYADLHPERPSDLPKLLQSTTTLGFAIHGYTGFAGTHRATVASEPIGFADADVPGRRVADPGIAYLLGLGCRWGAGGTAHSDAGAASVLLSPRQRACVEAFLRGVRG